MTTTIELTIKEVKAEPNRDYSKKFLVRRNKKIVARVFKRQSDFVVNFGICSINSENFESAKSDLKEFFENPTKKEQVNFKEVFLQN